MKTLLYLVVEDPEYAYGDQLELSYVLLTFETKETDTRMILSGPDSLRAGGKHLRKTGEDSFEGTVWETALLLSRTPAGALTKYQRYLERKLSSAEDTVRATREGLEALKPLRFNLQMST